MKMSAPIPQYPEITNTVFAALHLSLAAKFICCTHKSNFDNVQVNEHNKHYIV
jgi:hypothetical protein